MSRTFVLAHGAWHGAPVFASLEGSRRLARGQAGWRWQEIATWHDARVAAPGELSRLSIKPSR